jgi:probable phosphoglycerate mutase
MATKRIYFVRHGETFANEKKCVPAKDEQLNPTGTEQALRLAERLSNLDIQKIFISDLLRAKQTIDPTLENKVVELETNSVFGEEWEGSSFVGMSDSDERVIAYRKERLSNMHNPDWSFEDGESVTAVLERVSQAKSVLLEDTALNILVVSHATYLKYFFASVLLNTHEPSETLIHFVKTLKISNTGISLITIDDDNWRVIMINDHAHFAE